MELHDQRNPSPTLVVGARVWAGLRKQRVLSGWWRMRRKVGVGVLIRLNLMLRMLICALVTPLVVVAASSGGSQYSPTFAPGGLVAWFVCNGGKRNQIGGWLLYFYWQLYSGLLISAAYFAGNIQSYVPENFESTGRFALFLASTVPILLLFIVECAVATLLLSARTWDMLKLLRWTMVAEVAAAILGVGIDAIYFPDNLPLSALSIASDLLWLGYFFRSNRVRHVFYSHDWDVAVSSIYPLKPEIAT